MGENHSQPFSLLTIKTALKTGCYFIIIIDRHHGRQLEKKNNRFSQKKKSRIKGGPPNMAL